MLAKLKRGLRKPPRVILKRGLQEVTHYWREKTGGWSREASKISAFWTVERTRLLNKRSPWAIFHDEGESRLIEAYENGSINRKQIVARSEAIADQRFEILGSALPEQGPMPWLKDWRFDWSWPQMPERHIDHYAQRNTPYDVKFPWELSRLHFLLPLFLGVSAQSCSDKRAHLIKTAERFLDGWRDTNPLGHTVNWAPMESSMRVISLVLALDLARLAGVDERIQTKILSMLHQSLTFVWESIEDTDIRGNHYTANLAALLLGGLTIEAVYPSASRFISYAEARFEREVLLQFSEDGVNFEKSFFYHRLVGELFLLMHVALVRHGRSTSKPASERLQSAADFTDWITGPDGRVPVWGDSDDAEIFTFDGCEIADHSSFRSLAQAMFAGAPSRALPSSFLLTGRRAVSPSTRASGGRYFSKGAFFIVRGSDLQFVTDLGEVGLHGRGGHGHNDILSFVLWLYGEPVVVDPGSYIYSGDLAARNRYRSSHAHNGLTVDGEEIARLGPRPFRIYNDAMPLPHALKETGPDLFEVEGGHTGYHRLSDPVTHRRRFKLDMNASRLEIHDLLQMAGGHTIERKLQFAPRVSVVTRADDHLILGVGSRYLQIRWGEGTAARLQTGAVSKGYAQSQAAQQLSLKSTLEESAELRLTISWNSET
jgi:hypothetical protein